MRAKTADIQSSPHMAKRALGASFHRVTDLIHKGSTWAPSLPKDSSFPMQRCGDVRIEQTDLGVLVHLLQCTPCHGRAGRFRSSFSQPWPFNCIILSGHSDVFLCAPSPLTVHFSRHPVKFLEALYIIQLPVWQWPLLLTWSGSHSQFSYIFGHFILAPLWTSSFFPPGLYILLCLRISPQGEISLFNSLLCLQCPAKDSQYRELSK